MSMDPYEYTPLAWRRQIRLLRLHPAASPDDPEVSIDLVPILLDAAPSFEALSYAWGDPIPKCEIICSGRRAEIGPNLHSALFHLRRLQPSGKSPWIWADAICINQDDTAEREAQVRMMGDIYSRASITVIWLGEEDDHVTGAFDYLTAFRTTWVPVTESHNLRGRRMESAQAHALRAELSENYHSRARDILQTVFGDQLTWAEAFEDIWTLLRRPWFMRKWVIQEVSKSTHRVFLAGERWIPFVYLHHWFLFLKMSPFSYDRFLASYPWGLDLNANDDTNAHSVLLRATILSDSGFKSRQPLSYLLATTAMFKCGEPNDHIIALLGISAECLEFQDLIDYSISTDSLYRRLTCAHLTNCLNLRVLWSTHNMVPVNQRRGSSWIPNIEEMVVRSAVSDISNITKDWWRRMGNACGSTEIQATTSGNKLLVRGRIIDVIAQLGTDLTMSSPELKTACPCNFTTEFRRREGIWANWFDECQAMAESAGHDEHGFVGIMLVEFFLQNMQAELIGAAKKNFSTYRRILKTFVAAPEETTWDETRGNMDWNMIRTFDIIGHARWLMHFRRFGRTRYNRIGWMPLVVEEGDYICVFDGMELPYAVRQRPGPGGNYALVGDCYIPSLLNGEAMELPGVESVVVTLE